MKYIYEYIFKINAHLVHTNKSLFSISIIWIHTWAAAIMRTTVQRASSYTVTRIPTVRSRTRSIRNWMFRLKLLFNLGYPNAGFYYYRNSSVIRTILFTDTFE